MQGERRTKWVSEARIYAISMTGYLFPEPSFDEVGNVDVLTNGV